MAFLIHEKGLPPHEIVRLLIDTNAKEKGVSIARQSELLGISRSSVYYQPKPADPETLNLMNRIDRIHTDWPVYGARKIAKAIIRETGIVIGRKRTRTLMEAMGIEAVYQRPRLSLNLKSHPVYPYLLKNISVIKPNQVWGGDITYIKMKGGFLYLAAFLDWFSRFVLGWELSLTLEPDFVLEAARKALGLGTPDIANTDQGVQFTSEGFLNLWNPEETRLSMDHRGRCFDNIFTERLWRTFKYEEVYLKDYASISEAKQSIDNYFQKYNYERLHQSLNYKTPAEVYFSK